MLKEAWTNHQSAELPCNTTKAALFLKAQLSRHWSILVLPGFLGVGELYRLQPPRLILHAQKVASIQLIHKQGLSQSHANLEVFRNATSSAIDFAYLPHSLMMAFKTQSFHGEVVDAPGWGAATWQGPRHWLLTRNLRHILKRSLRHHHTIQGQLQDAGIATSGPTHEGWVVSAIHALDKEMHSLTKVLHMLGTLHLVDHHL